jgi:hypothetical protein
VQIREEHHILAQERELLLLGLLDLDHEADFTPDAFGVRYNFGSLRSKVIVRDPSAETGARLDEHFVSVVDQSVHGRGGQRDPVLVQLDLVNHAYLHVASAGRLLGIVS